MLALSVALSVGAVSCAGHRQIEIFECPDISVEAIEALEGAALEWYTQQLDPWCEALTNAAAGS